MEKFVIQGGVPLCGEVTVAGNKNAALPILAACESLMDEPSVMGTENALMAAALTPGATLIANAASEPHVQDLAHLLTAMGARVDGIGSNVMTVNGAERLNGAEFTISCDHT